MFCRKCGTQLRDDSLFCDKCGEKILSTEYEQQIEEEALPNESDLTQKSKNKVPVIIGAVLIVIVIIFTVLSISKFASNKEGALRGVNIGDDYRTVLSKENEKNDYKKISNDDDSIRLNTLTVYENKAENLYYDFEDDQLKSIRVIFKDTKNPNEIAHILWKKYGEPYEISPQPNQIAEFSDPSVEFTWRTSDNLKVEAFFSNYKSYFSCELTISGDGSGKINPYNEMKCIECGEEAYPWSGYCQKHSCAFIGCPNKGNERMFHQPSCEVHEDVGM